MKLRSTVAFCSYKSKLCKLSVTNGVAHIVSKMFLKILNKSNKKILLKYRKLEY